MNANLQACRAELLATFGPLYGNDVIADKTFASFTIDVMLHNRPAVERIVAFHGCVAKVGRKLARPAVQLVVSAA